MPVERKQLPSVEQPFDLPKSPLTPEPADSPAPILSGGFTLLPMGLPITGIPAVTASATAAPEESATNPIPTDE